MTTNISAYAANPIRRAAADEGESLPVFLRDRLESILGVDLSKVRIHVGPRAAEAAEALNAFAYTVGRDIFFAAGAWQPGSEDGLRLIAHEVAHTVQQGGAVIDRHETLPVSQPSDAAEQEAERFATAAVNVLASLLPADETRFRTPSCSNPVWAQLSRFQPAIFRQVRERSQSVSEESRRELIQHAPLEYLVAMFEDSYRQGNTPRVPPARVPGIGDWHRALPRPWLEAPAQRSLIQAQIRERLGTLAGQHHIDAIRAIQDRIGRVEPEFARRQLQQIIQDVAGRVLQQHETDLVEAIRALRNAIRTFATGRLRSLIFGNEPSILDQAVQYENFAGAMNIFRDVVLSGSTRFRAPVSQETELAAQAAVRSLTHTQRDAIGRDRRRVSDELTAEGRSQLRAVVRDRGYRGMTHDFPEQAIRE